MALYDVFCQSCDDFSVANVPMSQSSNLLCGHCGKPAKQAYFGRRSFGFVPKDVQVGSHTEKVYSQKEYRQKLDQEGLFDPGDFSCGPMGSQQHVDGEAVRQQRFRKRFFDNLKREKGQIVIKDAKTGTKPRNKPDKAKNRTVKAANRGS